MKCFWVPMRSRRINSMLKAGAMRATLGFAAACVVISVLASCNSNGIGIFYTLQNEKKISVTSKNLPTDVTMAAMTEDTTNDNYYVALGKLYTAADASSASKTFPDLTWKAVDQPSDMPWCSQVVSFNGKIYAVCGKTDGSAASLYSGTPSSSGSVSTWQRFTAISTDDIVQSIFTAGPGGSPYLFITAMKSNGEYHLYESADGTSVTEIDLGSSYKGNSPPVGVIFDSSDTNYLVAAGDQLFESTSPGSPDAMGVVSGGSAPGISVTSVYSSIYYSTDLNAIFLSTRDGYVYAKGTAASDWETCDQESIGLDGFGEIDVDTSSGTKHVVVVGADTGYFEIHLESAPTSKMKLYTPAGTGSITTDSNYAATDLETAAALNFFADSANDRLFALSTAGLWRNEPTSLDAKTRTWQR